MARLAVKRAIKTLQDRRGHAQGSHNCWLDVAIVSTQSRRDGPKAPDGSKEFSLASPGTTSPSLTQMVHEEVYSLGSRKHQVREMSCRQRHKVPERSIAESGCTPVCANMSKPEEFSEALAVAVIVVVEPRERATEDEDT